jgi:hypothetical protein
MYPRFRDTTTAIAIARANPVAGRHTRTAAHDVLAARTHGVRAVNVLRDQPRRNSHLVVPARIVEAA